MDRRTFIKTLPALTVLADAVPSIAKEPAASTLQPIILPKPRKMAVNRSWLPCGNAREPQCQRPEASPPGALEPALGRLGCKSPKRASWADRQDRRLRQQFAPEIDLYVAMAEGIYLYDAVPHRLAPVVAGDHRAKASRRSGVGAKAPVSLIFVADIAKFAKAPFQWLARSRDPEVVLQRGDRADRRQRLFVRRFAGLGGLVPQLQQDRVGRRFELRPEQRVLYAQTVGGGGVALPWPRSSYCSGGCRTS